MNIRDVNYFLSFTSLFHYIYFGKKKYFIQIIFFFAACFRCQRRETTFEATIQQLQQKGHSVKRNKLIKVLIQVTSSFNRF